MQPHKLFIGIAMVSLFITAGLFVMFGTASDSDDSLFDSYDDISSNIAEINRSKFSRMEQGGSASVESVYNKSSDQKEELIAQEVDEDLGWENLIIGPYRVIQRFTGYFSLLGIMVQDVAKILHIPQMFADFAMVAFLILIVFMIVYLIMRFQPRD